MGGASFPSGVTNMSHISSGAVVQLGRDGAVNVLSGAADIGQGAETVIAQIVAEELGVPIEDVRVTAADTGTTPLDPGTFGSGVTVRAGNAARIAAVAVRNKLFECIADEMEANPDDLVAKDGKIYVTGSPDVNIPYPKAIPHASAAREHLCNAGLPSPRLLAWCAPEWDKNHCTSPNFRTEDACSPATPNNSLVPAHPAGLAPEESQRHCGSHEHAAVPGGLLSLSTLLWRAAIIQINTKCSPYSAPGAPPRRASRALEA